MGGAAGEAMWAAAVAATVVSLVVEVSGAAGALPRFAEASEYRNGEGCPAAAAGVCDQGPESIFFNFLAAEAAGAATDGEDPEPELLWCPVAAAFPSLRFEIYPFHAEAMARLISASE